MIVPHIKKLQTRFFICYICVIIPILLLSCIIYYNQNRNIKQAYLNAKKDSLLSDKNYLENQLQQMGSYYNQFTACVGLIDILEEISHTNRQVVYTYQSQVVPQLNNVRNYDSHIDSIVIYTHNPTAAKLLSEFVPMKEFYLYNSSYAFSTETKYNLFNHFWNTEVDYNSLKLTYYAGFMYSSFAKISGILEINCNDSMFRNYARNDDNSATFICDKNALIYCYNSNEVMKKYFEDHKDSFLHPEKDSDITFSENNKYLISNFTLNSGNIRIIKLSNVSFESLTFRPLLFIVFLCFFIFIVASIIVFQTVFVPFNNISKFSTHLSLAHQPQLVPYSGSAPDDEVGELIRTYNQMTERINAISQTLHYNEIQLKNAQLEALQTQLNPHFFYGTLESIRMLAEAEQQTSISEMTFSFGNLMRYALSREYLVPISREINIVEQYLDIQNKRLGDRFTVNWDICNLDEKWRCPKFILFNIVENVFSHDICSTRRVVHINIIISKEDNELTISVENDGPGISPERLAQIQYLKEHPEERSNMSSNNNGRSIFNIHDRIQLFYGNNYGITISSEKNKLTICSVRLNKFLSGFDIENNS